MKLRVAKKARSKLALISKAVASGLMPVASLKMWYTLIRPTLEYAVGVWGIYRWPEAERIQLELGRLILGVSGKTASDVIRGELGLWTMEGRLHLAILRWWGKLVSMDRNRLCYKIYRYRREHIKAKHNSWCKAVRDLLIDLNLAHVWINEEIGDLKTWNDNAKLWIAERENRNWKTRILEKSKLRLYRQVKSKLSFEDYLTEIPELKYRREFTKIRSGTSDLRIETGRWLKEELEDRTCCMCVKDLVEDESHFLLDCYPYESLRRKMFQQIRYRTGDTYRLWLMRDDRQWMVDTLIGDGLKDKKHRIIVRIAVSKFILRAMRLRQRCVK